MPEIVNIGNSNLLNSPSEALRWKVIFSRHFVLVYSTDSARVIVGWLAKAFPVHLNTILYNINIKLCQKLLLLFSRLTLHGQNVIDVSVKKVWARRIRRGEKWLCQPSYSFDHVKKGWSLRCFLSSSSFSNIICFTNTFPPNFGYIVLVHKTGDGIR